MNVRGTSVVVSLLLSILGCGTASTIATGSLSGTATYAGQSDHSGITVTAGGFSTTTDAAGNYALGALPVGSYSVLAIAPRSTERTMVVSATVNAGANTAPAMVFTPAAATGSLSGTASYAGQSDHSGIAVTAGGLSATTDAAGHYAFDALPVGSCVVQAVAPRSTERTLAVTAMVSAGANTAPAMVFTPTLTTGALSGTATYTGRSDHAGITVTAGGLSTTTDAAGHYAFGALPVGSYSVLAVAPRSTERTMAVSATVNAGANTAPAMVFTPAQALAGQLTFMGTPLAGATVTLDGTGATTTTTTDANGVYSFANAEPGVHSLSFTSGPYSDQIPTVRYALDGGASVVAPFSGQVYAMLPFDLQGAPRATTVNIRVPARTLHYAPTLSADGALYFYGIGNDQGYASLYVGSTAGGPPVLVATDGYPTTSSKYQPKFSTGTTSTHLAYVRYNYTAGRYELCAVAIGAGPTAGPVKTLSTVSMRPDLGWEFSPQTTGPSPSIYFIEYDSATSVFTLRESNMDGGSVNSWDGVDSFYLSRKVRRVVFKQSLATLNRLVSVTATGASVGTSVIAYENWGATNTFTFYFHTFTPDETGFAYSITSAAVAGAPQLGLKRAQTGSVGALRVSATDLTPSPSCLAFNPAGTRIVWNRGGAGGLVTTSFDPVHIVSYVPNGTVTPTPATPTPPGSSCPTFTDDDRIWIAYNDGTQRLALAKADASAPPDVLDKDKTADLTSVFFGRAGAVYTRGSGNNLSFWGRSLSRPTTVESHRFDSATDYAYVVQFPASGIGALYRKRDYTQSQNNPYTLYWVGLGGADPVPVQIAALNSSSSSSSDGSKMLVSYYEEPAGGSFLTYAIVDMATGAKKILLRRGVNTAKLQDIGAAAVPKFIGFRNNSPMPYEHQDGVYIADP